MKLALLLALALSPIALANDPVDQWVQVSNDHGIQIFRKHVADDPVFAYKTIGVLNVPVGKLLTVSRDVSRQPEWVNHLKKAKILREMTPYHRVVYLRISAPWPVSDRDFVIDSQLTTDPVTRSATLDAHSVEDSLAPPDACCVRGIIHSNHVEFRSVDSTKTSIVTEAHVDPRGAIPSWLVNWIQKTFPQKSVEGLLKQAAKPDIQDFFDSAQQ